MKRKPQEETINQPLNQEAQKAFKEIQELVKLQLRSGALQFIQGLFSQEMEELCGPGFSRKGSALCHRAGSDRGSVILEGRRVSVKKPRAKKAGQEVPLQTYTALQSFDLYCDRVMNHMLSGVSTRQYEPLMDEVSQSTGLKKTTVSKAFVRGSRQALDEINGRDFSSYEWGALLLDGIEFQSRHVIVAMGITTGGEKLILGLREGSSENHEVCKDLLQDLIDRGLRFESPFIFVLDGSKALRKAVGLFFDERFPVQRCIRHKERNISQYLPHGQQLEFRRRWKKLHGLTSFAEAKKEHDRLLHWLEKISLEAAASLRESDGETLTVIRLEAPALLRQTFLSTNPIESAFSKVRHITGRVKHWRRGVDQVIRWSAASLLEAEKSFRIIKGYKEIPAFIESLKNLNLKESQKAA